MTKKTTEETVTEDVVTEAVLQPSPDASGPGAADVVAAHAGSPRAPDPDPEPPVAPAPLTPLGERLHGWLYGQLSGGPLSRNTEAWNAVVAALPELENIINAAPAEKE